MMTSNHKEIKQILFSGWHFSAYDHARDRQGITYQSTKPYTANAGSNGMSCSSNTARVPFSRTASTSYYKLNSGNEEQMKEQLYNKGPLYATICK